MFQYAAGKNIAVRNNTVLKLDISDFGTGREGVTPRSFALDRFNISAEIATKKEIAKLKKTGCLKNLIGRLLGKKNEEIKDPFFYFLPAFLEIKDNSYLAGYWQSEKYFESISGTIRQEFRLKEEFSNFSENILSQILNNNSVSLHVRRGDYATSKKANDTHGTCPVEYYSETAKIIGDSVKDPVFFIFSDDIGWAEENLKINHPINFMDAGKDFHDLILMSQCKHNIIANSSFSWWAAWLNGNKNKMVIAPKKWFKISEVNTDDRFPKDWIKI